MVWGFRVQRIESVVGGKACMDRRVPKESLIMSEYLFNFYQYPDG